MILSAFIPTSFQDARLDRKPGSYEHLSDDLAAGGWGCDLDFANHRRV